MALVWIPLLFGFAAMPKYCDGFSSHSTCLYSRTKIGEPAYSKKGKCLFCNPEKMTEDCGTIQGRKRITQSLKAFRAHYETHSHVYNSALLRVPDEWRETFHAQALKTKRGKSKKPRSAASPEQAKKVAEDWRAALCSRKRAFADLSSEEVTAYKKRRKADRNRVEKKFFLDNDIPKPEVADDVAKNDCGLPAACSTERAAFVEQWCKLGSWGICKQCRSVQPRPMEPLDTRRVAPAEITAKACKQCRKGNWVPQREEIPRPLRKLSLKLSRVLRPLDIDVGPVKKSANGYRHHTRMIGFIWCEQSVKEKIAQAGGRSDCLVSCCFSRVSFVLVGALRC